MNNNKNDLNHWNLFDEFTVRELGFLILDEDPERYETYFDGTSKPFLSKYITYINLMIRDIKNRKLLAKLEQRITSSTYSYNGDHHTYETDYHYSTITKSDIKKWLLENNIKSDFFDTKANNNARYLDENHPFFTQKLAIAIRTWDFLADNPDYLKRFGNTKDAIIRHLEDKAEEYGLLKKDGSYNRDTIDNQLAKILNWDDAGGAKKTLTKIQESTS